MADLGRWLSGDYRVPGTGLDAALDDDPDAGERGPDSRPDNETDD
jgi:endogenous inhibitor of DNA gyrase (YacG/DUF329 family)